MMWSVRMENKNGIVVRKMNKRGRIIVSTMLGIAWLSISCSAFFTSTSPTRNFRSISISDSSCSSSCRSIVLLASTRKRKGDFVPSIHNKAKLVAAATATATTAVGGSNNYSNNNNSVFQQFTSKSSLHPLDDNNNNNNNSGVSSTVVEDSNSLVNKEKNKLDSQSIAQWLQEEEDDDEEEDENEELMRNRHYSRTGTTSTSSSSSNNSNGNDGSSQLDFGSQIADTHSIKSISLIETKVSLPSSNNNNNINNNNNNNNNSASSNKQQHVIRAEVKETGQDMMSQYVKSMGQHELLSKDAEQLLGTQIQILVKYEQQRLQLEQSLGRVPTFGEWAEEVGVSLGELRKQMKRSQRAKAALMEANLRLVITVARQTVKMHRSEINFQDACQEGILGLQRACDKFDPTKGFRFSTYAIWWIKRDVHKSVTEQSRGSGPRLPAHARQKINDIKINERLLMNTLGRKPSNDELATKCNLSVEKLQFYRKSARDALSLDKKIEARQGGKGSGASGISNNANGKTMEQTIQDEENPTPTEAASQIMLKEDVRRLLMTLSPKEQAVIRLRFGLDDGKPRTLADIGKTFKVEKERIRKIETRALLKLRQPYRNDSVKCYVSDL